MAPASGGTASTRGVTDASFWVRPTRLQLFVWFCSFLQWCRVNFSDLTGFMTVCFRFWPLLSFVQRKSSASYLALDELLIDALSSFCSLLPASHTRILGELSSLQGLNHIQRSRTSKDRQEKTHILKILNLSNYAFVKCWWKHILGILERTIEHSIVF